MTKEECLVAIEICDLIKDISRDGFYYYMDDIHITKDEQENMYAVMNSNTHKDALKSHSYYKAWHTKQAILDDMANAGWLI